MLVSLTPKGRKLMVVLFPKFNAEEAFVTETLTSTEKATLARTLRKVALQVEPDRALEYTPNRTTSAP